MPCLERRNISPKLRVSGDVNYRYTASQVPTVDPIDRFFHGSLWAVPKYADLVDQNDKFGQRQKVAMRRLLEATRTHLKAAARGLPKLEDLVALPRQKFDSVEKRLSRSLLSNTRAHSIRLTRTGARLTPANLIQRLGRARERLGNLQGRAREAVSNRTLMRRRFLDSQAKLLGSLSYQSVLARGYAVVRDGQGQAVRLARSVQPGADLAIEFSDGTVQAEAKLAGGGSSTPTNPGTQGAKPDRKTVRVRGVPKGGGQGSLF